MDEPGTPRDPAATDSVLDEPGGGDLRPHPVPLRLLAATFGALIALTVATVAVTYVDLGRLNLILALSIATVKGVMVAEIFMHLRWDRPFHRFLLLSALSFVALFIGILLLDSTSYQADLIQGFAPGVSQ
ncbi:MAG TPA: cytochrome C oxidase subunit IV family protein [Candidatus Krumholzibacteria bacterium]|nr:cytochrome C oxidase subunit IV family protein [Candidatus Krumholzibacteria bacterium]HPD70715.1 cytochrome C oxidase subunit IV family protein [Candidatus Krumholzibacteria bacterium]HRY39585.1 cytochrome C oxidase subunit IV family protein [Candidatus Krumholzibacteria bacterium]